MNVAPHNCPNCGLRMPIWTPDAIVETLKEWVSEHGFVPKYEHWYEPARNRPTSYQVNRVFGSWDNFLASADLEPRYRQEWTREAILDALVSWYEQHDKWPSTRDWKNGGLSHPASRTVYTRFGSFVGARGEAQALARKRIHKALKQRMVPVPKLARLLRYSMAEEELSNEALAELSGVSARTIYAIIHGERDHVQAALADRLVCATGRVDAWHSGELAA